MSSLLYLFSLPLPIPFSPPILTSLPYQAWHSATRNAWLLLPVLNCALKTQEIFNNLSQRGLNTVERFVNINKLVRLSNNLSSLASFGLHGVT